MNADELASFDQNPFFKPALQLRKWDDQAKNPDLQTPSLDHFFRAIENALSSASASRF